MCFIFIERAAQLRISCRCVATLTYTCGGEQSANGRYYDHPGANVVDIIPASGKMHRLKQKLVFKTGTTLTTEFACQRS